MALEPIIRGTVGLGHGASLGLGELDWLVRCGLTELGRHALPEFIIALAPDDFQRLDPVSFVWFIVGHRAERLIQLTESRCRGSRQSRTRFIAFVGDCSTGAVRDRCNFLLCPSDLGS